MRLLGLGAILVLALGSAGGAVAAGAHTFDKRFTAQPTKVSAIVGEQFTGQVVSFTDATPETVTTLLTQPGAAGDSIIWPGKLDCKVKREKLTIGRLTAQSEDVVIVDMGTGADGQGITITPPLKFSHPVGTTVEGPACSYDYSATINWGDGTTTTGIVDGGPLVPGGPMVFTVSGSHAYAAVGTYDVSVTVTPEGETGTVLTPSSTVVVKKRLVGNAKNISAFKGVPVTAPVATFTDLAPETITKTLATPATAGAIRIWIDPTTDCIAPHEPLKVDPLGAHPEQVTVTDVGTAGASGTGIGITPALQFPHSTGSLVEGSACSYDYSATINWGDGSSSAGTIVGNGQPGFFEVDGTHTWAAAGSYHVQVTVTPEGSAPTPLTPTSTATVTTDSTKPTVTITAPADGAVYPLDKVVTAKFKCTDNQSGAQAAKGTVKWFNDAKGFGIANGAPTDTSRIGGYTFTVDCSDRAGNETIVTHDYTVVYTFNGFNSPIGNPADSSLNLVHAGDLIKVGFGLNGDRGLSIGTFSSVPVSCPSWAPHSVSAGGAGTSAGLSYGVSSGHYTYGWQTSNTWAGTCRQFSLALNDGTPAHTAVFMFFA